MFSYLAHSCFISVSTSLFIGLRVFLFLHKKYSSFYCFCFTFQEVVVAMTNINCDDCDDSDDHGNWDCDISWDLLAYVVYLGTCRDRIHALSW